MLIYKYIQSCDQTLCSLYNLIYSCKGFIQGDQPGSVLSGPCVFGHYCRKQGYIHGHGFFPSAEGEEYPVCQLTAFLSCLLAFQLKLKPLTVVQHLPHNGVEGLKIAGISGGFSGFLDLGAEMPGKFFPFFRPHDLRILLKKLYQSIGIMHAATIVLCITAPLNVALNILCVHTLELGLRGSALATGASFYISFALLAAAVPFTRARDCWGGFDRRALSSILPFLKLAIPGILQLIAEFLAFESASDCSSR